MGVHASIMFNNKTTLIVKVDAGILWKDNARLVFTFVPFVLHWKHCPHPLPPPGDL